MRDPVVFWVFFVSGDAPEFGGYFWCVCSSGASADPDRLLLRCVFSSDAPEQQTHRQQRCTGAADAPEVTTDLWCITTTEKHLENNWVTQFSKVVTPSFRK